MPLLTAVVNELLTLIEVLIFAQVALIVHILVTVCRLKASGFINPPHLQLPVNGTTAFTDYDSDWIFCANWFLFFILFTSAKEEMQSSWFVCVVGLLATLHINFQMDLHDIFRKGCQWANE